jgi:hypothetical protein
MALQGAEFYQYLEQLKRIRRGAGMFDPTQMEKDFMGYAAMNPGGTLALKKPKLYSIKPEEEVKMQQVLGALNHVGQTPTHIDISGGFTGSHLDELIFLSLNQGSSDNSSHERAYLHPLIEKVYLEASGLISDFSIVEGVYGKVKCSIGDLSLEDLPFFPEKFFPGPYNLEVTLDTPHRTISQFGEFTRELESFLKNPQEEGLASGKLEQLTQRGIKLRKILGSLSRYHNPGKNNFSVQTNSCLLERDKTSLTYLYCPNTNRNAVIYFGENPFSQTPHGLVILNGAEKQKALAKLIELGVYEPNLAVLDQRIKELSEFYEDTQRRAKGKGNLGGLQTLVNKLTSVRNTLNGIASRESQKKFTLDQSEELYEFLVCPKEADPVIHDLMPHLSWNNLLASYHDTKKFMHEFEQASKSRKHEMVSGVISGMKFSNQQNLDVNLWMYQNHKGICEKVGVNFSEVD